MDILVTTPKSEIDNSRKEGEAVQAEGGYWFRTFRFKPKCVPGEKIFFVEDGLIRGYGKIFDVSNTTGEKCDVTGRNWGGSWVLKYDDWSWLKRPIPWKGFQGIRYIDRLPELRGALNGVKKHD